MQTDRGAAIAGAFAITGGAAALVLFDAAVRRLEASTSAAVVALTGMRSAAVGAAVVFPDHGRLVGYALTAGCSVAFLLAPLLLVVAGLVLAGRLTRRKAVVTSIILTALLFTVNQLRFAVIAWSMHVWGFETGYERSHIFLGTFVSTLGVAGGLALVLTQMTRRPREVADRG